MARWTIRQTNLPVLALGLVAAGFSAVALTLGSGDAVVERGFERALASMATQPSVPQKTATMMDESAPFWLRHVVHKPGSSHTKPLAVGDSITINSGGRERILNVVDVAKLDSAVLPASSGRSTPLLLVTCREEANPEARPVRLLIEAEDELPALSLVSTPRTL
jgi:hypothetical protein